MEEHRVKTDIKESFAEKSSVLCRQVKRCKAAAHCWLHIYSRIFIETIFLSKDDFFKKEKEIRFSLSLRNYKHIIGAKE